jgi:tripartite-type tricarboxylate transporter receptor subunit TctC
MKKLVLITILCSVLTALTIISGVEDALTSLRLATPAFAATAAPRVKPFYEGKTITFIAATAPGGGTDTFGRLVARFLPRHIPGKPNIIVQNMPGGGTLVGTNYVYAKAKRNGLFMLAASGSSTIPAQQLGKEGVLYDMNRMRVLMGTTTGTFCFVSPETGIRQPKDITSPKTEIIRGGESRESGTSFDVDIPMQAIFKVKQYRPLYGYGSMGPARLAFMRGETNMHSDNVLSYKEPIIQQMIKEGKAIVVFQSGMMGPGGKLLRHPVLPNVPTVAELYRQIYGVPPSGIAWETYQNLISSRSFGKILAFPPETPSQRVQELEQALGDMVKDPAWAAESARVTGEALIPPLAIIGEPVRQQIKSYLAPHPEITRWLENWVKGN